MRTLRTCLLLASIAIAPLAPAAYSAPRPATPSARPASAVQTAAGPAETCAPIDKAGVAALFDAWNVALASLDPDIVAQRYWEDAVLLPIASNVPRTTPAMLRDYFVRHLDQHPRGRIDSRSVQIGCNLVSDMGTYTISMMDANGKPGEVAARYTFVHAWRNGEWRIVHHHTSAMPEALAAPPMAALAGDVATAGRAVGPAAAIAGAGTPAPAPVSPAAIAAEGSGPRERPADAGAAAAVVDSTRMFLNAEASPPFMEFYPPEARARRESGRVALRVCADPEGRLVGEPKVLKSSGSERLDGAARQWALAAKWVPATSNRRSVEGCTEVSAQFRP